MFDSLQKYKKTFWILFFIVYILLSIAVWRLVIIIPFCLLIIFVFKKYFLESNQVTDVSVLDDKKSTTLKINQFVSFILIIFAFLQHIVLIFLIFFFDITLGSTDNIKSIINYLVFLSPYMMIAALFGSKYSSSKTLSLSISFIPYLYLVLLFALYTYSDEHLLLVTILQ